MARVKSTKAIAAQLGRRIRDLRREKKVTLIELSHNTGVAQATLSRIETGLMTGTVESHQKIAGTLGVSLARLYEGVDERHGRTAHFPISAARAVTAKTDQIKCELLTQEISKKKITPLLVTLGAHGKSGREELDRGVEKFVLVLEGTVKVTLDKEEYVLGPYETLYFDGSIPHQLINPAGKQAKVFCAVSPAKI